jgi:hypothetical protein
MGRALLKRRVHDGMATASLSKNMASDENREFQVGTNRSWWALQSNDGLTMRFCPSSLGMPSAQALNS